MATRNTDTITISLPAAMAQQMEMVQKKEHRTRSELLREAWRVYFESRYPVYIPTRAERTAIAKGRADMKAGRFVTLDQLIHDLESSRHRKGKANSRKASR